MAGLESKTYKRFQGKGAKDAKGRKEEKEKYEVFKVVDVTRYARSNNLLEDILHKNKCID